MEAIIHHHWPSWTNDIAHYLIADNKQHWIIKQHPNSITVAEDCCSWFTIMSHWLSLAIVTSNLEVSPRCWSDYSWRQIHSKSMFQGRSKWWINHSKTWGIWWQTYIPSFHMSGPSAQCTRANRTVPVCFFWGYSGAQVSGQVLGRYPAPSNEEYQAPFAFEYHWDYKINKVKIHINPNSKSHPKYHR